MTDPAGAPDQPTPPRPTGVGWPGASPPPPREPAAEGAPAAGASEPATSSPTPPPPPPPAPPPPLPRIPAFPGGARPPRYQPSAAERPGTVTGAAVILFVSAGLAILACCGLNFLASEANLHDDAQGLLLLVSGIFVVSAAVNVWLGYYILQGRQWARVTTIVVCVIGIIGALISFVMAADGEGTGLAGNCLGVILNAVVIGLLSGATASEYFRSARG